MKYIFFLSLPFYALDQWTKHLVLRYVDPNGYPQRVIPDFFDIVNVTNTGAAFGSFKGNNTCAEVQIHPSGKFVYASNRGHDSIALFGVEPETGKLIELGHQSTGGKTPRHFALDPGGKWLLAENQDSDTIVVFRVDSQTGKLTATGSPLHVGAPVCVLSNREKAYAPLPPAPCDNVPLSRQ